MIDDHALRVGEDAVELPDRADAEVYFIGTIRTPWLSRSACPRHGDPEGPPCQIIVDPRWLAALDALDGTERLDVLYWMHLARRDLVLQNPKRSGTIFGTFALRSPMRPNPIAVSSVTLIGRAGGVLTVRGLDCVDGTPLIDIKPIDCPIWRAG